MCVPRFYLYSFFSLHYPSFFCLVWNVGQQSKKIYQKVKIWSIGSFFRFLGFGGFRSRSGCCGGSSRFFLGLFWAGHFHAIEILDSLTISLLDLLQLCDLFFTDDI